MFSLLAFYKNNCFSIFLSITSLFSGWKQQLYDTFIEGERYKLLIEGLRYTIIITLGALVIGVLIGSLISILKYTAEENPKMKFIDTICNLYVTVIRGIPVVVVLLIFYFIILKTASGITVGIVTFGINSGAYMAELIRSGINAIPKGQMEAARSLGLSRLQATIHIILPQAMKNIIPAIGNEMIALLKETAVAGYVAVIDLTRAGTIIRNSTYDSFNPLMIVALTYLILVVGLTKVVSIVERRLSIYDQHTRHN